MVRWIVVMVSELFLRGCCINKNSYHCIILKIQRYYVNKPDIFIQGLNLMKKNIAITIRSFGSDPRLMDNLRSHCSVVYLNTTGSRLASQDLKKILGGVMGVIAGTEPFDREVITSAKDLRVISRVGVGTDSIDLDAAAERGVKIVTTNTATVQPVAEHTLALLFSLLKKIPEYHESTKNGDYSVKRTYLLQGKVVGIIGLGRIGFRVGELLSCLGCKILFFDPFCTATPPTGWKKADSSEELFSLADVITLHAPAQKDGKPIMSREAFNQCRTGVLLINTARASLVDETALTEALQSGKVAGAGLDVTKEEPYAGPLRAFSQVIITPHVASNTIESRMEMENEAVRNLISALGGMES
jgi:D-3-phosphoglycerate dehydrogenase / 2-oxoglutarate reductase